MPRAFERVARNYDTESGGRGRREANKTGNEDMTTKRQGSKREEKRSESMERKKLVIRTGIEGRELQSG